MSKTTQSRAKDVAVSLDDAATRLDNIKGYVTIHVGDAELEKKIAKLSTDTRAVATDIKKKLDHTQG